MLPSTALLCVAMILKGVSTRPTGDSAVTSAGGVDKSTAILSLRDKSTVSFGLREITQSGAELNVRDVNPSGLSGDLGIPGGSITSYPVTVDFVAHCPYDSLGYDTHAAEVDTASMGGRVEGYIVGTCQEVDPGSSLMSINWKDGGFGNMTFYKDKHCTDEMAATVRPKWGWHNGTCFDFSKLPKLLSFKGDKTEDKGKRETISSAAAVLGMRDTTHQDPGGLYDCGIPDGCIRDDPPPLPEAVNFYDKCPFDAKGNPLEAQKTGGNVTGYIVGTCQGIDSPGPTMTINYKDGKFDRMIIYHDEHCTDRITAYDRGRVDWQDYSCVDLSKIRKVLSFKGVK